MTVTSDTPAATDLSEGVMADLARFVPSVNDIHADRAADLATRGDLMDVQANVLDAVSVLEARLVELAARLEILVASAEHASTMAATVMSGGLGALLRGQK